MTAMKPFSVAKLAERWGCSRVHIYWLIENKQITPFNIGPRSLRIAADEVERFEKCGYVGIEMAGMPTSQGESASLYVPTNGLKQNNA